MPSFRLRRTALAFGACLVAALLVAACGDDDATTVASGSACELVTTAQVSEAMGTPMNDGGGHVTSSPSYDVCEWSATRGRGTPFVTLNLYKQDGQLYYDQGTDQGTTQVPGIGEKARWTPGLHLDEARKVGRLEVLQGNYYFIVSEIVDPSTPDAESLAAASSVASTVLESLP
jgi:hypothetical protein